MPKVLRIDGKFYESISPRIIRVEQPGERGFGRSARLMPDGLLRLNKAPAFALIEDCMFYPDEIAEAKERARLFSKRVSWGTKFSVHGRFRPSGPDLSCLAISLISRLLINVAKDVDGKRGGNAMAHPAMRNAIDSISPMVFLPRRAEIVDAAATLPRLKSLVAAFGASEDLHALSGVKELKDFLDYVPAIVARAERRMAVGSISAVDTRLAAADRLALMDLAV